MAATIASAASKRIASLALSSSSKKIPGVRELHSTATKQMSSHDYDEYLHAEHMYNLPAMKHRKLKIGLGVFAVVAIGTLVPIGAVIFQQKKAMIM